MNQNEEAMKDLLSVAKDYQRRGQELCELRLSRTRISGHRVYLAGREKDALMPRRPYAVAG